MSYHGFTKEGTIDESSLLVGDWNELVAEVSSTHYQVGNCPEGVLEIGREYYEHVSTSFPRKTDMVIPTRVWMKFDGKVEEIHSQNVSWLLGQTLASNAKYIYVGVLAQSFFFSLYGKRTRVSDGVTIEFKMHKCIVRSAFNLGGGDAAQGSPLSVEALDDTEAGYGGSATNPLGYIWVPAKT